MEAYFFRLHDYYNANIKPTISSSLSAIFLVKEILLLNATWRELWIEYCANTVGKQFIIENKQNIVLIIRKLLRSFLDICLLSKNFSKENSLELVVVSIVGK